MANSDNENKPSVSNKIRKMREDRRLTQADLARMSGLSLSSIKAYESGIRNPKSESMEKIITAVSHVPKKVQVSGLKLDWNNVSQVNKLKTVEMSDESIVLLWKGVPLDSFMSGIIRSMIGAVAEPVVKKKEGNPDGKH